MEDLPIQVYKLKGGNKMVKTIIVSSDGTIIGIGDELIEDTKEPGVVWLDGAGFGVPGQKVYEKLTIPEEVEIDKYKYIDGEFIVNEDYKPYVDVETLVELVEQQNSTIANLNQNINLLENSILELTSLIALLQGGDI
jgi:hypothetical protein